MAKTSKAAPVPVAPVMEDGGDPTGWILDNEFANFVLMHTSEIKYMCMIGYTFLHGCKVFKKIDASCPSSYKIVSLAMACTGGGIIVPILLNTLPVTIGIDAYPIAIMISYLLHTYFPILREVLELSPIFKAVVILFYETMRCYVVTLFTGLAASTIAPSQFSFPVFGPIICGTIAGCGGMFLPFNKGLAPIEGNGLAPAMFSALVGTTFYHLITQAAKSGTIDLLEAPKKAKVLVATWFIVYTYYKNGLFPMMAPKAAPVKVKSE